jgi:uncharacterized protein (DUF2252 family)
MFRGRLLPALVLLGCPPEPTSHPEPATSARPAAAPDPLQISYRPEAFADAPSLLNRVAGSAFGYFRYTNEPFIRVVCERYGKQIADMPTVNVHGDAHLEQYAVAADGRGLADFDAATLGPPVIDLARFATSLALASADEAAAERAILAFLRGYEQALEDPATVGPEPAVAARIRSTFAPTGLDWLNGVEKLMTPLDGRKLAKIEQAKSQYVNAMLAQNPDLTESFFQIKRAGALKMGLGSAHEAKFLSRVEGPSPLADDDVILEMKQMAPMPTKTCIRGRDPDPLRVVVGQSRLAMSPQRFLGYVDFEGRTFYVHAWRVHYTELSIGDIRSSSELAEVAYDVGLQLGKGHPKNIADPHGSELRNALKELMREVGPSLPSVARSLADRVKRAHAEFKQAATGEPPRTQ